MADNNSLAKPHKEDRAHLQHLLPDFGSQTDVVLCVEDSDHIVVFPVHKLVLSGHSVILSQMLENLQPVTDKTLQRQRPSLLLMDDGCSAVRSALACIYRCFPISDSRPQGKSQEVELDSVPEHALHMRLYDKYNMARIAELQTEALMQPLTACMSATKLSSTSASHVLLCATTPEQCGLSAMLSLCEEIIIKHATS